MVCVREIAGDWGRVGRMSVIVAGDAQNWPVGGLF